MKSLIDDILARRRSLSSAATRAESVLAINDDAAPDEGNNAASPEAESPATERRRFEREVEDAEAAAAMARRLFASSTEQTDAVDVLLRGCAESDPAQ